MRGDQISVFCLGGEVRAKLKFHSVSRMNMKEGEYLTI